MSYTSILKLWPGTVRSAEVLREFPNSYGSGPLVWCVMGRRWLGFKQSGWLFDKEGRIWQLAHDRAIPERQRAVLAMTFDKAYIAAEHYERAVVDIRAFLTDFAATINPDHANHWPAIADLLEVRPDCPAIGFNITSVAESLWQGEWNDKTEEHDEMIDWTDAREVYAIIASPVPVPSTAETG